MELIQLKRKDSENNKEYIFRILYRSIMTLKLKPGELISEKEIADICVTKDDDFYIIGKILGTNID